MTKNILEKSKQYYTAEKKITTTKLKLAEYTHLTYDEINLTTKLLLLSVRLTSALI